MNVDLNNSACIQSADKIGSTVYHSICSGAVSAVPWGSADWFLAIFIGLLVLMVAVALVFFVINILSDLF